MTSATVIYESTIDEYPHERLFDKINGKQNIAVIAFTTDRDVFGGFYSVEEAKQ